MPRPRRDGADPAPVRKVKLTDRFVRSVAPPTEGRTLIWDTDCRGLALAVMPTGRRSWRLTYRHAGRLRVYTLGAADVIALAEARRTARDLLGQVARGGDPAAAKSEAARAESFADVAMQYRAYAKGVNKSWPQAAALVDRLLLPRWGRFKARDLTRGDMRALMRSIAAPITANQTLAAASAIFAWAIRQEVGGITVNPCVGVDRNATASRERVLTDAEVRQFWAAFGAAGLVHGNALKTLLLTGQRPGEIAAMRREHIDAAGWWTLPGAPDPALGWPGTKNAATHRVWLTEPVRALIAEIDPEATTGFVFSPDGRGRRPLSGLDTTMRTLCKSLGIASKATPHDLRRTHGTTITGLGFGRDAMNRAQNHREGGIADVYDRHNYDKENRKVQAAVTRHILTLVEGHEDNVVALKSR